LEKEGKKRNSIVQFIVNALTFVFSLPVKGLSYVFDRRIFLSNNVHPPFKYEFCKQQCVLIMIIGQLCEATLSFHQSTIKDPACITLDGSWMESPQPTKLQLVV
jgi:hypothetical protein